jgi:hypothetical protein
VTNSQPPADVDNVRAAIERPLTEDEERVIPAWLAASWRIVRRKISGVEARLELAADAPDYLDVDDVVDVIVAMVERKLRNPDGLRAWSGDDYDQTVDSALSSGQLYLTEEEIDRLAPPIPGGGNGIYSIPLGGGY